MLPGQHLPTPAACGSGLALSLIHILYLALGLFFLYSFFGWLAEVAFSAVSRKKFVNTGFLTGPVCPIYGVGILFIDVYKRQAGEIWINSPPTFAQAR